jgi:thioredoxin 1
MLKILKFFSKTCAPCRALNPIIDDISKETGVLIESIDAVEDTRASQYGIRAVPTLIFLKDDIEVDRKTGLLSKENLKDLIEKYNE